MFKRKTSANKVVYEFTEKQLSEFCESFFQHSSKRLAREAARISTEQVLDHLARMHSEDFSKRKR